MAAMTNVPARLCTLVESRLPLTVESDASEDDWNVVGPAVIAAATGHLRAIAHLQETFPSGVIVWQLLRSRFEYVATYAWVAADPSARAEQWLKSDYVQRLKMDNDFRELGHKLLQDADRRRVADFRPEASEMLGSVVDRAKRADEASAGQFGQLEGYLLEENRGFRALYPLVYRNGSQFTHPSSHAWPGSSAAARRESR